MSVAIRALDKDDVDPQYMAKLAKVASAEIISTKVRYKLLRVNSLYPPLKPIFAENAVDALTDC